MKKFFKLSIITLNCSVLSLSNTVYATTLDGIYSGTGTVSSGMRCAGDSYHLEMKVIGSRFEALVTRIGGEQPNSQFRVSGNIDSSGNLNTTDNGGKGPNLFFHGQIRNNSITGSSGANNEQSTCVWTYTLNRKEKPQNIRIWFNTFIPTTVASIAGPVCAHADNRNFSTSINASSRTHQIAEFEVETNGRQVTKLTPITVNESNRVGESYFVDCKTGEQRGNPARASVRDIRNSLQQQGNTIIVNFNGRIGLPLLPSCPIDFDINIAIDPVSKTYRVTGGRDGFPAYEAYLQIDNNSPQQILAYDPRPSGINPASLEGLCMWDRRNAISESGKF